MTGKIQTIVLAGTLIAGSGGMALAQTPASPPPDRQAVRATEALNLLEFRGDGQFSNFAASGRDFTADVTKGGKLMHVMIDPDTREIQTVNSTS